MKHMRGLRWILPIVVAIPMWGHCDSLDGPVVKAARKALERRDANPVLAWVRSGDEQEIRTALARTLDVRKAGGTAELLADQFFFETVVRLHRAGEGAPYTGLKPAGGDAGPAVEAADRAVESGVIGDLVKELSNAAGAGVRERFERVKATKGYAQNDVKAGREFVAAYVQFIHYVDALHKLTMAGAADHEH